MTRRERLLAAAAAAIVGVLAVGYVINQAWSAFARRAAESRRLAQDVAATELEIQRGMRTAEQLNQLAERALPAQRELAQSLYQNWLVKLVAEKGLQSASVDAGSIRPNGDIYEAHTFTLSAKGNLKQVTALLYEIQHASLLHRVQRISLKPIKDKKDLDLSMTLEILSLPIAPPRQELPRTDPSLVAERPLDEYQRVILERNPFGPANRPPRLDFGESFTAYRGQPFEIQAKAEDPDRLDQVQYEADLAGVPGARFSATDGKLAWVPRENGEYRLFVTARDDGLPEQQSRKEIKITVKDPPPPPEAPPPRPAFAVAKFAVITAITEAGGRPEVWIHIRTEGRTLKLTAGQKSRVGELDVEISAIAGSEVALNIGGKVSTRRLGQSLVDQ